MKSIIRILLFICVCVSFSQQAIAQASTLYFMENIPSRSALNPGFIPTQKFYIDLPSFYVGIGNNSFAADDLLKSVNGQTISAFDKNADYSGFLNVLKPTTNLRQETRVNIIGFGVRNNQDYFSFGIAERTSSDFNIPKDMVTILLEGVPLTTASKSYILNTLSVDASTYLETAFGYSRQISTKLSVGGKVKLLLGQMNTDMSFTRLSLIGNETTTTLHAAGTMRISLPMNIPAGSDGTPDFKNMDSFSNPMKFTGMGVSLDAGMAYKAIKDLTISAAITDFGFIRWKKSNWEASMKTDTKFNNMSFNINDTNSGVEQIADTLKKAMSYSPNGAGYTTNLAAHIRIGAEYSLLKNKIGLGMLYDNRIKNNTSTSTLMASANFRPLYWVNASLSYAFTDNSGSAIGLGLNLIAGPVNIFFASDYVPTSFADGIIPKKTKQLNAQVGMSLTFGHNSKKKALKNMEFPAGTPDIPY